MFNSQKQIRVVDRIDHLAKTLTAEQIEALYQSEKGDLMLESVTLEDLENTLLFQCEPVPQLMLEAFKSKASQLAIRVKKFANQLERRMSDLTVGEVEISKPRKSGAVAVQMAKIPLSDGQSVSIAFHAPDDDPLKINPSDTLIAFRFLLNSRDVTHVVAAKGGQDVSLKEATTKLGNLAEQNSDKFTAAQAKKNADAAALEEAQAKAQELEEQAAQLNSEASDLESKGDEADARIKRLKTQIETQNEIQEELRKQLASRPVPAAQPTGNGGDSEADDDVDVDPVVALFRNPKLKAAVEAARKVDGGSRAFSTLGTIADIDINGAKGMDRSLFVSNFAGRIKTLHKNGNQEAVDAILTMVAAYNDAAPKAAITARNGIWKLGTVQDIEVPTSEPEGQERTLEIPEAIKYWIDEINDLGEAGVSAKVDGNTIVFERNGSVTTYAPENWSDFVKPASDWIDDFELRADSTPKQSDSELLKAFIKGKRKPKGWTFDESEINDEWGANVKLISPINAIEDSYYIDLRVVDGNIQAMTAQSTYVPLNESDSFNVFINEATKALVQELSVHQEGIDNLNRQRELLSIPALDMLDSAILLNPNPEEAVDINSNLFWYGLRARPFSIGAVPSIQQSAILTAEQALVAFPNAGNGIRHGAVGYSEQLSDKDVSNFEFVPLFGNEPTVDDDDVEYTARELLQGWLDSKGLSQVEQSELDTLTQAVSLGSVNTVFAKVIRELPVFKNRKADIEEYKQFQAELEAIDADLLKRVADEMGIVTVKGDDADEAAKGKTAEEQQLLALDPNEFSFGAIFEAEGRQSGKDICTRIRSFITQGKKQGKLPKDLKVSAKQNRGGYLTSIRVSVTDLPESVQLHSNDALQSMIDNGSVTFGVQRYTDETKNLIDYVTAYISQFDNVSGDPYGDYGSDHEVYGARLEIDSAFERERMTEELASFTETHQEGTETEKDELDVNGIRDALDADSKLQLEQLEEFTNFKIQLGRQEITLPNGKVKPHTIKDESDALWVIDDCHDDLATALEEKALEQLNTLTDWTSERTYYGEDITGQIQIGNNVRSGIPDSIDGSYGRSHLTAWINKRSVLIYPVVKNGEYKFAAYLGDKRLGEFDNHGEFEMLCIFGLELTDKQPEPEQENSAEMEYIDKLKAIRDYTGEASQEQLEQYQTELEAAYSHFQEAGTYAENEALMEAAFANYVALQDQVAA